MLALRHHLVPHRLVRQAVLLESTPRPRHPHSIRIINRQVRRFPRHRLRLLSTRSVPPIPLLLIHPSQFRPGMDHRLLQLLHLWRRHHQPLPKKKATWAQIG